MAQTHTASLPLVVAAVTTPALVSSGLLDQVIANTPVAVAKPTAAQRAEAKGLIAQAKSLGGLAAALCAIKVESTEESAAAWLSALKLAIASQTPAPVQAVVAVAKVAPVAAVKAVAKPAAPVAAVKATVVYGKAPPAWKGEAASRKQWAYVAHLRGRLRATGDAAAVQLARKDCGRTKGLVTAYITECIGWLKARWDAKPEAQRSGRVCSVCWEPGCNIGPFAGTMGR